MTLNRVFTAAALASLCAFAPGCAPADDDESANAAADSLDGTSDTTAFLSVAADPAASAPTEAMAATAAATAAQTYFQPAGCVTATAQGATTTYRFTNCRGPYGLVNLNGELTATYSARRVNGWTVNVRGNLTANRAQLRPDATAVITYSGSGARTATVTLRGGGTGPRGVAYTNSGGYTSTWDGNCFGLNGAITTAANGGTINVTVSNYNRCRGECPTAGGTIAVSASGSSGSGSFSIAYSGGPTATVTGGRGTSRTVRLFCGS